MKKFKLLILYIAIFLSSFISFAQNNSVGIGTTTPDNSSILELNSNHQGFLVPRLDSIQLSHILTPAIGLLLYNTTDNCFWYKEPSGWKRICNTDAIYQTFIDSLAAINQDITNLYDSIAHHTSQISNLYSSVQTINNNITVINDSLNNYYQYISNIYDSLNVINTDLTNIYDTLHLHSIQINNLFDSVIEINNHITIINDSLNNYYQYFQNINDSLTAINTDLSNIHDTLHIHSILINNLFDSVQVINQDISTLFDSVSHHTQEINTINSNINTINQQLTQINNQLLSIDSTMVQKWDLNGNSGTNAAINFVGTIDNVDLVFRTNNNEIVRITKDKQVGIGTSVVDQSAILQLETKNRGFLVPRLTSSEITLVNSPADGLLVYNTDVNCFFFFKSNAWKNLCDVNFDSLFVNSLTVDSLIGHFANFDTMFANYIYTDSIFTHYLHSDTAQINTGYITNIYNNLLHSDTILAHYIQSDTVISNYANINNLSVSGLTINGTSILNYTDSLIDSRAWRLLGNTGTNPNITFLGTSDSQSLSIRTNSLHRIYILSSGFIGVNTTAPTQQFDVNGKIRMRTGGTSNYVLTSDAGGTGTWTDPNTLIGTSLDQKWDLFGNTGTDADFSFVGTTDPMDLVFRTNNIENMRIVSGGLVGINTNTPSQFLDVNGKIRLRIGANANYILVSDATGVGTWTTANSLTITNKWDILGNTGTNAATNFVGTKDAVDLVLRTNNTEKLRILSGGFVGINTNLPTQYLDVNGQIRLRTGATANYILVSDATGVGTWTAANSLSITDKWDILGNSGTNAALNFIGTTDAIDLVLRTNNTDRLHILSGGAIGVGTNLPTTALDVNGKIRLRTGATNNYILVSDAFGVGTWTAANSLTITNKWDILGNSGTSAATNFVGTTDAIDLVLRTNNTEKVRVLSGGNVGINNVLPLAKFQVSNGSVMFDGTTGTTPTSGIGTRMMWIPAKAAFRAGKVATTEWDDANIGTSSFSTGEENSAVGIASFSSGYRSKTLKDYSATFGYINTNNALYTFVAGTNNSATGNYHFILGFGNTVTGIGNIAIGGTQTSTASNCYLLGDNSTASGTASSSVLLGHSCSTSLEGTMCMGDISTNINLAATAINQFNSRYAGGYWLFSDATYTAGVRLASGGSGWIAVSDKNKKENIEEIDFEKILKTISVMDVTKWSYIAQNPKINDTYTNQPRHIGPMAQDFYKSFGLGETEIGINSIDIDGINLAAIKGLEKRTTDQAKENEIMKIEIEELKKQIEEMRKLIRK